MKIKFVFEAYPSRTIEEDRRHRLMSPKAMDYVTPPSQVMVEFTPAIMETPGAVDDLITALMTDIGNKLREDVRKALGAASTVNA
jgi:hypothetical protein